MANKLLDYSGLQHFWKNLKLYINYDTIIAALGFTPAVNNIGTTEQLSAGTDTTDRVWTPKIIHDYVAANGTKVSYSPTVTTGNKIGTLTIDGQTVDIVAPYPTWG